MRWIFLILLFFSLEFKLLAQHEGRVENDTLFNKAKLYKKKGVYDLALKNYFKALEGYQFKNEIKKIIDTYNGIGLIYIELEKTLEAKKYFYLALNNAKKIDDIKRIAYSLNNRFCRINYFLTVFYYNCSSSKKLNHK